MHRTSHLPKYGMLFWPFVRQSPQPPLVWNIRSHALQRRHQSPEAPQANSKNSSPPPTQATSARRYCDQLRCQATPATTVSGQTSVRPFAKLHDGHSQEHSSRPTLDTPWPETGEIASKWRDDNIRADSICADTHCGKEPRHQPISSMSPVRSGHSSKWNRRVVSHNFSRDTFARLTVSAVWWIVLSHAPISPLFTDAPMTITHAL